MKNIKLFVFDVGNTLVDTKSGMKISDKVLKDLFKLRESGYILGLSTLRNEEMIKDILEQFSFDFLILMNGGVVKNGTEVVYSCPINDSDVEQLKCCCHENKVTFKQYDLNSEIYAIQLKKARNCFVSDGRYQSYIWDHSGDVDITASGVTKLNGIRIICDLYGVSIDKVAAFGDGFNDIEMLEAAGVAVAMQGAPEELCRVADIITGSAADDGISTALRIMEVL